MIRIVDSFDIGDNIRNVVEGLKEFNPHSVKSVVLLRKHGREEADYEPDFAAFDIPDEFVVGYGLDYQDMYRNIPYLAALEDEDIKRHQEMCRETHVLK